MGNYWMYDESGAPSETRITEDTYSISTVTNGTPVIPIQPIPTYKTTAIVSGTSSEKDIQTDKLRLNLSLTEATEDDRELVKRLLGTPLSEFFPEKTTPPAQSEPKKCEHCGTGIRCKDAKHCRHCGMEFGTGKLPDPLFGHSRPSKPMPVEPRFIPWDYALFWGLLIGGLISVLIVMCRMG